MVPIGCLWGFASRVNIAVTKESREMLGVTAKLR